MQQLYSERDRTLLEGLVRDGRKASSLDDRRTGIGRVMCVESRIGTGDDGWGSMAQDVGDIPEDIQDQVKRDALYAHYIARQARDIAAMERDESHKIPENTDYSQIRGLSNEVVAKLSAARPETIAHASRLEGMTPSALMLIIGATKKHQQATGS